LFGQHDGAGEVSSRVKTATAGLRMADAGAVTTGGINPSKCSPV
jgi:hypothetical protein